MKRFHTQLNLLLSKHLLSKSEIARQIETDSSVLSKLTKGDADCSADTLGKLARCFPLPDQLRLLAAWVEDRAETAGYTPAQLRASLGSADGLHVPPGLRDDLELILAKGGAFPEFRAIISNLADLLRPAKDEHQVAEAPGPVMPAPKEVTYVKKKK